MEKYRLRLYVLRFFLVHKSDKIDHFRWHERTPQELRNVEKEKEADW